MCVLLRQIPSLTQSTNKEKFQLGLNDWEQNSLKHFMNKHIMETYIISLFGNHKSGYLWKWLPWFSFVE